MFYRWGNRGGGGLKGNLPNSLVGQGGGGEAYKRTYVVQHKLFTLSPD